LSDRFRPGFFFEGSGGISSFLTDTRTLSIVSNRSIGSIAVNFGSGIGFGLRGTLSV
jgi:hypothetical protein